MKRELRRGGRRRLDSLHLLRPRLLRRSRAVLRLRLTLRVTLRRRVSAPRREAHEHVCDVVVVVVLDTRRRRRRRRRLRRLRRALRLGGSGGCGFGRFRGGGGGGRRGGHRGDDFLLLRLRRRLRRRLCLCGFVPLLGPLFLRRRASFRRRLRRRALFLVSRLHRPRVRLAEGSTLAVDARIRRSNGVHRHRAALQLILKAAPAKLPRHREALAHTLRRDEIDRHFEAVAEVANLVRAPRGDEHRVAEALDEGPRAHAGVRRQRL